VLRDTHGVIGGPQGAAARLGVRRTSLLYRMEKLWTHASRTDSLLTPVDDFRHRPPTPRPPRRPTAPASCT